MHATEENWKEVFEHDIVRHYGDNGELVSPKPFKGTITKLLPNEVIIDVLYTNYVDKLHWPREQGWRLGTKVLVFYDFGRAKVNAVRKGEIIEHVPSDSEIRERGSIPQK